MRSIKSAVAAVLLLAPSSALAWGFEGHQIVAQIARAPATTNARIHFTELVGTHPLAAATLAAALRHTLSTLHAPTPLFA